MNIITTNKKAFFDYEILEKIEAGIALIGDEVKSIRAKNISLADSFAVVHQGEMNLLNCYIGPYSHAYQKKDITRRTRKLLLHRKEINKLIGAISKKGLTILPLKVYINGKGLVKIELGMAKIKRKVDKKKALKERDINRETSREMKEDKRIK